ncbi:hypothetical protein ABZ860_35005 [Microbispora sp. NPDC046973]|uniref:hypothetical protein n=1 Tax=Microbispora sp. NPDC046973 TaxID=3155022 RepID=UPI0033EE740C
MIPAGLLVVGHPSAASAVRGAGLSSATGQAAGELVDRCLALPGQRELTHQLGDARLRSSACGRPVPSSPTAAAVAALHCAYQAVTMLTRRHTELHPTRELLVRPHLRLSAEGLHRVLDRWQAVQRGVGN